MGGGSNMIFLGNPRTEKCYEDIISSHLNDYILVSCQYPKKVDVGLYGCPCVNIHYGELPYYRGMAPIYHQMMNGSTVGVTLHYMDDDFDTGDIIDTFIFPHHGMTANECYDACEKAGKELLLSYFDGIVNGTAPRQKQGDGVYWKSPDWNVVKKVSTPFFSPAEMRAVFATHFEGKQYPVMEICGRNFELRAA
jgi:methionyl-tRNA formyltransferase